MYTPDRHLLPVALNDNNLDLLRDYLARGKDPNSKISFQDFTLSTVPIQGVTVLQMAIFKGQNNTGAIKELINAGADVNLANSMGYTPLHLAVKRRRHDVIDILLESGAHLSINDYTLYGKTALYFAICNDELFVQPNYSIVCRLLECEYININILNRGSSALLLAVEINCLEIVELLLSKGADPNYGRDISGGSCLHVALSLPVPNYYIVRQLLWKGADIYCTNVWGYTPIDILLLNIGYNLNVRFAMRCLKVAVLKCEIQRDLIFRFQLNPQVFHFVNKCCQEVEMMKNDNITKTFRLYDFATFCFDADCCVDPNLQIFMPVLEKLVRGFYHEYFYDLFDIIPDRSLRVIAEVICSEVTTKDIEEEYHVRLIAKMDIGICRYLSRVDIFCLIVAFSNVKISETILDIRRWGSGLL